MKKVTLIGGGTGTFVVLSGLKNYEHEISAIVATTDSGGSTGRLRDQYGVLPPGDLRQCLVALSEAPDLWRELFLYRFEKGDFKGHNFGNIFLTALEQIAPDYDHVVDMATYILQTKGHVIPVTFDKVHLCAEYEDGETIMTEDLIDTAFHKKVRIKKAYLEPEAEPNAKALTALCEADVIVCGPGDMYTSIVPNLLVKSMRSTISQTKAHFVYISNLMTKQGQTAQYTASDHVHDLERYIGRKVDTVIVNNTLVSDDIRAYYEKYGESIVEDDLLDEKGYTIVRTDLLATEKIEQKEEDTVLRSILRHDSLKVAAALHDVIRSV